MITKHHKVGAGISFIDAASVKRYKKQHYSFRNSGKMTTVNKKKSRLKRDASNGSCVA